MPPCALFVLLYSVGAMEGQGPKERDEDAAGKGDDDEHPEVEREDGENVAVLIRPDISSLLPIPKLISVDLWSDDSNVVEKALLELAGLCYCANDYAASETNRESVHKAEGASSIVGAMRRWYNNPGIQAAGCNALAHAAIGAGMKPFSLAAKEGGAFEAVVCAMKNYPDNLLVQSNGCEACANLCSVTENADHLVNALNGLDLIVAAMRKFPDDELLQRSACHVLRVLCEWQELRTCISDGGGRRLLLDAIETHKDETKEHVKELQEWARKALKNLL